MCIQTIAFCIIPVINLRKWLPIVLAGVVCRMCCHPGSGTSSSKCDLIKIAMSINGAPRGGGGEGQKGHPPFLKPNSVFKVKCPNCASAVRAVVSTELCQNLSHIILKPNRSAGVVLRDIVICVGRGGCIPPPGIFKHVFDEYNFSIILNLFDNNKPYAKQA